MHVDPQTIARNMVPTISHPVAGDVQTIGAPVKFSQTPGGINVAAPTLGQHTCEVLEEVNFSKEEIENILHTGAAVQSDVKGKV